MKLFLREKIGIPQSDNELYHFLYTEDVDKDATIEKVAILAAIDNNKCDFCKVAIGVQNENEEPQLKGWFDFDNGENDDIGRTIKRAFSCLEKTHSVFWAD